MTSTWCRLCGVAALLACFATANAAITRGPYLQRATPTSVVVRWRTDVATDSRVRCGTSTSSLGLVTDVTAVVTDHEIVVSGLTNDTRYYYAVGSTAAMLTTTNSSQYFLTHPLPGAPKPMRVWVIGDAGTADANQTAVRNAFQTYNGTRDVNVWLQLGDNAYNSGTDAEYQTAVFNMYSNLLRRAVTWPTVGNHDTAQSTSFVNTYPYFSIFTLPTAGEAGGVASGTEHYYSFDHGMVHFICLDSMTGGRSTNGAMANWLRADLAATTNHWLIAYWHHPPYTHGSHNSDTESELIQMRQNILPILEAGGVDLVLCGHSHCYERSQFINGFTGTSAQFNTNYVVQSGSGRGNSAYIKNSDADGSPLARAGTVYCVAGSSGQATGGTLDHAAMFVSLNNLGSMVLDITTNRLDAVFLRETGATNDWFSIRKDYPAPVTNGVWTATGGGSWTNATRWSNAAIPNGISRTANFATLNLTANATVTLDSPRLVGGLLFADTTPTHNWVLNPGAAGTLTLQVTNGSPVINVSNQTAFVGCVLAGSQGFTKTGGGLLVLSARNTINGAVALNEGRLRINGSLLTTSNLVAATNTYLEGNGTILGRVSIQPGATFAPGSNAVGTLTISNALTLAGTTILEIARTNNSRDSVTGLTSVTYGGTLRVTNLAGALAVGDAFKFFSAAGYSGAFANIILPALPSQWGWSNTLAANGTLSVYLRSTNVDPVAVDDFVSTAEDAPVSIKVLANDRDTNNNVLSIQSVTPGTNGTTSILGTNVIYTPATNFNGMDAFTCIVIDGQGGSATGLVTVTVTPVDDAPVVNADATTTTEDTPKTIPVLVNDTDVDGDILVIQSVTPGANGVTSISGTNILYTPATNWFGNDSFAYVINDGHGGLATGVVAVAVTPVNDRPVAVNDPITTDEDAPVTIPVLANDFDVDTDTLVIQSVTTATNGVTSISGTNVIYRPNTNWTGTDVFNYVMNDGQGGVATGRVFVTVTPANDPPIWTTNLLVLPAALLGNAYSNTVAGKATNVDAGDVLSFSKVSGPAWLGMGASGVLSGTPGRGDLGTNFWIVQVSDTNAAAAQTTLRIVVSSNALFEAELAALSGARTATTYAGYSGTGYVDYQNASNDYVQWTVPLANGGRYTLAFRYALNSGSRPLQLTVNGVVLTNVPFPATGAWTNWSNTVPLAVTLNSGTNTIRTTAAGSNGGNVDYLLVTSLITNAPSNLRFTWLAFTNGSSLALRGGGPDGQGYRVLAATNIALPASNWSEIGTGLFNGGSFFITDPQATNLPARFYRVVTP
jgi:autotransporter-associated beta strand protein